MSNFTPTATVRAISGAEDCRPASRTKDARRWILGYARTLWVEWSGGRGLGAYGIIGHQVSETEYFINMLKNIYK